MELISTSAAPAAIGPYSQAVKLGNLLFTSGQIPLGLDGQIVAGRNQGTDSSSFRKFERRA